MDHQAFELLMSKLKDHDESLYKIESQVGELWQFRWWVAGVAAGAGAVMGVVASVVMNFLVKKSL